MVSVEPWKIQLSRPMNESAPYVVMASTIIPRAPLPNNGFMRDFPGAELSEDGEVILKIADPGQKQAVMKQLVESYDVDGIQVFEPSLNDIFVEYAGRQE